MAGKVDAVAVISAASKALRGSKKKGDPEMLPVCCPKTFPPIDNAKNDDLQKYLAKTIDAWVREALSTIIDASRLNQEIVSLPEPDEKLLLEYHEKVLSSVRVLTRVASNQGLPATIILTANAEALTEIACAIGTEKSLNDSVNVIRQAFRVTTSDFQDEEPLEGRTTKCYELAVLLLRLYVKLKAYPLAEGTLELVNQYTGKVPDLKASPWKTQVQYCFYSGMFNFYKQKYAAATECFETAIDSAERLTADQYKCLMAFAIPASYVSRNRAPTQATWEKLPKLRSLYEPLIDACRTGAFTTYQDHLTKHGNFLRSHRLYLVCDAMLGRLKLNLLRRTWEISGRPKRLELSAYTSALQASGLISSKISLTQAAEFYVSQFIVSGEVKGYIHHELQLVMLSKKQPFPNIVKPIVGE